MSEVGGGTSETGGRGSGLRAAALAKTAAVAIAVIVIFIVSREGCGRPAVPPIRQRGAWLVVENQTKLPWKDVSVTLNAYYRGVSPTLAAGGQLEAPLDGF